ncbi:hypothetical protein A9Q84_14605 [Halobacteriovorax marinus]|uniref:Peptidase n=1 Tax=Halobacteriovorax marinus TaxID=97084 RepID=A0A1Y5F5F5_9BACT|nr:hypothetical protein A9Q84_14605 [Halobacteriovorax marinus]
MKKNYYKFPLLPAEKIFVDDYERWNNMTKKITNEELDFLLKAKVFLEEESVLIKISNILGKPLELLHQVLPENLETNITKYIHKSLTGALSIAMKTSKEDSSGKTFDEAIKGTSSKRILHNCLTATTGVLGGFFGEAGLIVELPITTTLIMRNIVEVGSQYEGLRSSPDFSLQCLEVFTLGSSKSSEDDALDSTYYSSRMAMSQVMRDGSQFIAANSAKVVLENAQKGTASPILTFITRVAAQFELVVTEKMLAEMIPVVGAVSGAALNVAFTDYYGKASKYHFGIIYLEEKYGKNIIEDIYNDLEIKDKKEILAA